MNKQLLLILISLASISFGFSQTITWSGSPSFGFPQGKSFVPSTFNQVNSFSLGFDGEVLFFPGDWDEKIGLGLTYHGEFLFGTTSTTSPDFEIFVINLYAFKGMYRVFPVDEDFSPYGALGLGLSQLITPEAYFFGSTDKSKFFSMGIKPEIGLEIFNFRLFVSYLLPVNYRVEGVLGITKLNMGAFLIGAGYSRKLFL